MSDTMQTTARIYVAGHGGLVGSALVRRLQAGGYNKLVTRTHAQLDLTNRTDVENFFATEKPEYVFLAAAKVGGIHANNTYPADFIAVNLVIQNNVIEAAYRHGVKRLLFLGSSCIYPKLAPQPLKEEYLLTGPLESTNRPYAIAKIAGIEMCWAFNRQYGTQFLAVMPTNLYGPGDNYDLANSHVIPALIRKMHEAKVTGAATATVWGSGKPLREFLYSEDMADACVFLMSLTDPVFQPLLAAERAEGLPPVVNIGSGEEFTIGDLAHRVAQVVGFDGKLLFDTAMPDGTPRKLLDVSRISRLGWKPSTSLSRGLTQAYANFCRHAVS
jgi:GDP-L-fucose synthase